ncbi:M23 family metallopeptidase [Sediminibacillus albus]|uniref:Stage IV sporulation protein FA n=1 Tax=Sediminibacillus albus TaxID=407036 RepID=A0A1G9BMI3_9BACI|nr:M23 family metallopeptidase [Sediminibacillus albus]SDK40708.1 stage IV sporulation protein FA [Sediminibacillus albus]
MKKDVQQVRRNIAKRKKENPLSSSIPNRSHHTSIPQEEEKHGYMPFSSDFVNPQTSKDSFAGTLVMKVILAAVIFFVVSMVYRMDAGWAEQPKQWTTQALKEEFPFASVNAWYQEKFGSPLAVSSNQEAEGSLPAILPVNGTVSQSFQTNGEAIRITANEKSEVVAVNNGIVIFAGNNRETGKTIIIQHPDRSKSIYGHLSAIDVYQYQFVGDNHVIGEFDPSQENKQDIYFAIQKNNQFLDPVQVMQVDEQQ